MPNQTPLNPDAVRAGGRALYEHAKSQQMNGHPWDEWEDLGEGQDIACYEAAAAVSAYVAVAQPEVRGYIIVDKKTNAIDWDGELHTSIESAIDSMTGSHQSMCRTAEEEDDAANDGRTAWWRIYSIHTVTDGPVVDDA